MMTPIKKVKTMAMPPDVGIGVSWEERSLGMSSILIRRIIRRVMNADKITSEKAKERCVRNALKLIVVYFPEGWIQARFTPDDRPHRGGDNERYFDDLYYSHSV